MRCVSGARRYRVAAGPCAGRARHGAVRGGGVPAPAASAADYCRVERAPYPRLSAQRPAAKWQLYDPQQGDVRFSPQTWLIQDDFAAIAAAVQQGWASPAAGLAGGAGACRWDIAAGVGAQRSGAFRHPRGMAGGAVAAAKTRAAIDALREGLPLTATPVSAEI